MKFDEAIEPEIYIIRTPDGIYEGESREGLPHGFGKYISTNGKFFYEGQI